MVIERKTAIEILAAFGPVAAMIAVLVYIGSTYASESGLSPTGGQVLVGAIAAFVLVMTVIGIVLSRSAYDEGAEDEE